MDRSAIVGRGVLVTLVLASLPLRASGQSPVPEILGTVDTRTTDGATIVGGPVEVMVGVVLLGVLTAVVTGVSARLMQKREAGG